MCDPALALVVAEVIHLLALSDVLGTERLTLLCKLASTESNLDMLMRYRGVLFGLLKLLMPVTDIKPVLRSRAFAAGLISGCFLWRWPAGNADATRGSDEWS